MALTNAEKQHRHRQRIKAKLRQADDKVCAEEVEAFRQACEAEVTEIRADPDAPDYSMADMLIGMLKGDSIELQGPFLARALNLPADPWPGLTYEALLRMTKGRVREAQRLGLPAGATGPYEVDFLGKMIAAKNRKWLEKV